MHDKGTDELFAELKISSDVENFIALNQSEFTLPLHEFLNNLLKEKNLSKRDVIHSLNFDQKHAYHIFSGSKKPSRSKLLAISRAMNLNLQETQHLLRYAKFGNLYPHDPFDSIIIYSIEHNLTVTETNLLLEQLGELPFNS